MRREVDHRFTSPVTTALSQRADPKPEPHRRPLDPQRRHAKITRTHLPSSTAICVTDPASSALPRPGFADTAWVVLVRLLSLGPAPSVTCGDSDTAEGPAAGVDPLPV